MRSVIEHQNRALEFERQAEEASQPSLKRRYADLAACYRLLADERSRMIQSGEIFRDDLSF
ncbi:hypothetical protein CWO91_13430 [Bradyrhizobium genosp. SA-3]|uniref:hypothetical protein n=1 Tax=Bradyrhizobium genosp. SA-3 TaxID=508868 RepID=UPI00102A4733|nr:hypothetical protein [Bradyrhizobium genosp. SA-3]RZN10325.1 hypothetical protein CWO91_13430 [Bradyrhizobium genosp. SA-3]